MDRSHTRQMQAGAYEQILCATREAKNRRYRTTDDVERHDARFATTSDPALQPMRVEVACMFGFFSREVLSGPGRVPSARQTTSARKSAVRLPSALPRIG